MSLKVINFFGAPGAGKTTAALSFTAYLKRMGYDAEYVPEFAKTQVWAETTHLLSKQNWVFAQQEFSLSILDGKIEYAVLDSPLLLSAFYAPNNYPEVFEQLCLHFFNTYDNFNFFMKRDHAYQELGRIQNESEALVVESKLLNFLDKNNISFKELNASECVPERIFKYLALSKAKGKAG